MTGQVMQLYCGSGSGFARKTRIVALELGLDDRVEVVLVAPQKDVDRLAPLNPMGKVPVLTDGARRIFDSSVICEYFCAQVPDRELLPAGNPKRFDVLTEVALGDGTLEAGMLWRAEMMREPDGAASAWQFGKLERCLSVIEASPRLFRDLSSGPLDLADIAIGCALGWLEFRLKDRDLLRDRPATRRWFDALDQRPSFAATRPYA